jgi:hypothetical protein
MKIETLVKEGQQRAYRKVNSRELVSRLEETNKALKATRDSLMRGVEEEARERLGLVIDNLTRILAQLREGHDPQRLLLTEGLEATDDMRSERELKAAVTAWRALAIHMKNLQGEHL